jgi:ABC-type transport system substrate-binding protein
MQLCKSRNHKERWRSNIVIKTYPFRDTRRAMALTLDRKAFIDTINEGKADIGGAILPPPEGVWGMPAEMLRSLPGYDPDIAKNRAEARNIMDEHGYGPNNRLKITVSTRNIPQYRDPAVILINQLKQIYIDGDLEEIDTVNWYPQVMRKDYIVGLNLGENGLDDPDQTLYENFACGAERNYTGYCNPDLEREFDRQSRFRARRWSPALMVAGCPRRADCWRCARSSAGWDWPIGWRLVSRTRGRRRRSCMVWRKSFGSAC